MSKGLNALRAVIYGKYRNLTAFGEHVGWQKQKVNRIVNGKTKPSLDDLETICEALGITLNEGFAFFKH